MSFFEKYWHVMLFGILGIIAGAIITRQAIKAGNQKLLDQITAQINALKGARLTATQQEQLNKLKAQYVCLKGTT